MNISNLAKLHGGYIYNPMITDNVVNLSTTNNVFNERNQEFINFSYLTIKIYLGIFFYDFIYV